MTEQDYSIPRARDLLACIRNTLLFLNSPVPEMLDVSVTNELLSFLEDKSEELDMILLMLENKTTG